MLVVVALGVLSLIFPFAGPRNPFWAVASVLLFVALATGLLCLVFTPLAYRVRQIPPPRAVAIAAVLIGALPIVTLAVLALIPH